MKEFTYTITDPQGIHARPAGLAVKEAKKFESKITIEKGSKKGDLKKIFKIGRASCRERVLRLV